MTTRITDKDFYTMIRDLALDVAELPIENELVVTWAEKKLDQIERKRETAAKRAAEKKSEDPLVQAILDVLTDELQSLSDITSQIEINDVTVGKVSYRLNAMTEGKTDNPLVEKGEIVVKEEGSRARRLTGYKRIG